MFPFLLSNLDITGGICTHRNLKGRPFPGLPNGRGTLANQTLNKHLKWNEGHETDFNSPYMKNLEFVNPHDTLPVKKYYWAEKFHLQQMGIYVKPTETRGVVTTDSRSQESITAIQRTLVIRASVDLATEAQFWCKFFSLGVLIHSLLLLHLII